MPAKIHWATRLKAAEKRGHFTQLEIDAAKDWGTCAVGERHNYVNIYDALDYSNYYKSSWPDSEEFRLGMNFMYAVSNNDIEEAQSIFAELQKVPVWEPIS